MNIRAKYGDKVIVTETSVENGYEYHSQLVKEHLEIGKVYEVHSTEVGSWSTDVFIVGFPDIRFNSVCFEDYEDENRD